VIDSASNAATIRDGLDTSANRIDGFNVPLPSQATQNILGRNASQDLHKGMLEIDSASEKPHISISYCP